MNLPTSTDCDPANHQSYRCPTRFASSVRRQPPHRFPSHCHCVRFADSNHSPTRLSTRSWPWTQCDSFASAITRRPPSFWGPSSYPASIWTAPHYPSQSPHRGPGYRASFDWPSSCLHPLPPSFASSIATAYPMGRLRLRHRPWPGHRCRPNRTRNRRVCCGLASSPGAPTRQTLARLSSSPCSPVASEASPPSFCGASPPCGDVPPPASS